MVVRVLPASFPSMLSFIRHFPKVEGMSGGDGDLRQGFVFPSQLHSLQTDRMLSPP